MRIDGSGWPAPAKQQLGLRGANLKARKNTIDPSSGIYIKAKSSYRQKKAEGDSTSLGASRSLAGTSGADRKRIEININGDEMNNDIPVSVHN